MPPRFRTAARRLAVGLGLFAAGLLTAEGIARLPPVEAWTKAMVMARLPPGVEVGRATLTFLPPGASLYDISLGPGASGVNDLWCRIDLAALLAGRIAIDAVVARGATVTLVRTTDGWPEVTGSFPPLLGAAAGGAPLPGPPAAAFPAVIVTGGRVTFVDRTARGAPRPLELTDVQFNLGKPGRGGTRPLRLAGELDPAGYITAKGTLQPAAGGGLRESAIDIAVTATGLDATTLLAALAASVPGEVEASATGTLDATLVVRGSAAAGLTGTAAVRQSSGEAHWHGLDLTPPAALSARFATVSSGLSIAGGNFRVARMRAGHVGATDIECDFAYEAGTVRIASARERAYGGIWTQRGKVTLGEKPIYAVTFRAEEVECEPLLTALAGGPSPFGCERFNLDAQLHGPWSGARSVAREAAGTGRLSMRGGTIPSSSIVGALLGALEPLAGRESRPPSITAPTRVDWLTQNFALGGGRIETENLSLATSDYTLTGAGSIGLDGSLDLDTEVALTPNGVTKLLVMASLPVRGDLGHLPPIPTHIGGTLADPAVHPQVSGVPMAIVHGLFAGATGAANTLGGEAASGIESVEQGLRELW